MNDTGSRLYVAQTDRNRVAVYELDADGKITAGDQGIGLDAEIQGTGPGQTPGLARPHSLAISPASGSNPRQLYVAAQGPALNGNDGAIIVYTIASDGTLTYKGDSFVMSDNTIANPDNPLYTQADGLRGAAEVRISNDGKFVYVTGLNDDSVTVFARDLTPGDSTFGKLSVITGGFLQTTTGSSGGHYLDGARGLAISPDQKHVYVTGRTANTLVVFDRNSTTGLLSPAPGPSTPPKQVIHHGDTTGTTPSTVPLETPTNVIVSPDGAHVYVTSAALDAENRSTVSVFSRNSTTGLLTFLESWGDTTMFGSQAAEGLGGAINLAISPDGKLLFVTGHTDGTGPNIEGQGANPLSTESDRGSLVTFARNPATGLLQYLGVDRRSLITGAFSGSITGVSEVGGKALIATASTTGLKKGDLVDLTNAGSYVGLQKVREVSVVDFTIEAAYAGGQTPVPGPSNARKCGGHSAWPFRPMASTSTRPTTGFPRYSTAATLPRKATKDHSPPSASPGRG